MAHPPPDIKPFDFSHLGKLTRQTHGGFSFTLSFFIGRLVILHGILVLRRVVSAKYTFGFTSLSTFSSRLQLTYAKQAVGTNPFIVAY